MASGDQWAWGHRDDYGLHTVDDPGGATENVKSGCPPGELCCDNLPQQVWHMARATFPQSGEGGGDVTLVCERIQLNLDPEPDEQGKYVYRGVLADAAWDEVPDPILTDRNITVFCDNAQQNPDEEDCTLAIVSVMDNKILVRNTGCCCKPFCFSGSTPGAQPDQTLWGWTYEIDPEDGKVACAPNPRWETPCPQEGAELKPCGEKIPIDLAFKPAQSRAVAENIDIQIEGEAVEVTFFPAASRARANPFTLEIDPAGTDDCCQGPGNRLNYSVYMEWANPGSGLTECVEIISGDLDEEPPPAGDSRIWSALTDVDPRFDPPQWPVRCACFGSGDDCTQLLGVTMNGSSVIPRFDCSCTPPFAITTDNTNIYLGDFGINIAAPLGPDGPGIGDEGDVAVWVYVWAGGASANRPPNACTPFP